MAVMSQIPKLDQEVANLLKRVGQMHNPLNMVLGYSVMNTGTGDPITVSVDFLVDHEFLKEEESNNG